MKIRYSYIFAQKRLYSSWTPSSAASKNRTITLLGKEYTTDDYTNITPKIISYVGKNLHNREKHPLNFIKQSTIDFFYSTFRGKTGNPIFSVYDNISPVVTVKENFDTLLVPESHSSRQKTDCFYINREYMLRAHTTAHQAELILMGLDNFLIFGDVYRRDEIDKTHYPVFHQADGVYTLNEDQIKNLTGERIKLFDRNSQEDEEKQSIHSLEASKFIESHLKNTLESLVKHLYKKAMPHRWVSAYFPFTHPSWELEILLDNNWIETLGCGIMRHDILKSAGAGDRIGWAFGLGMERLAMQRYNISDIRYFWSEDSGFLSQFENATADTIINFKEVSKSPQCINDLSFWIPADSQFTPNDFYDLVRNIGSEYVEQVKLMDEFVHPKTNRKSHCYRIIYRHMERPLQKTEINKLHMRIAQNVALQFGVEIR